MKCEICDRDPRHVHRAARRYLFQGLPNPYPGPCPEGDGRGWVVPFCPPTPLPLFDLLTPWDGPWTFWTIRTCGDEVCIWRARHHGVPGAVYQQPARRPAA